MNAGTMRAAVFGFGRVVETEERRNVSALEEIVSREVRWSPARFAHEQIRGLVRQVFSLSLNPPIKQVVFSAIEPETDIQSLCRRVGETLALETLADVAVVGGQQQPAGRDADRSPSYIDKNRLTELRRAGTRARGNLWLLPSVEDSGNATTAALHKHLGEIRAEFEYSIVVGPASGESDDAVAMAQFADGMILVLSAERTRRITALKVRDALDLARVRLLGTVLSDREFPIPEKIYRRL